MNITKTISLLDEQIREVEQELKGTPHDTKVFAIIETLRAQVNQAALDGERYRKAGETLEARLGEHAHTSGLFPEKDCFVCNALIAYRQAVEQKEV